MIARGPAEQRLLQEEAAREQMTEVAEEPVDLVIVDAELSPQQIGNLARAVECEVTDRTGIIVEIFHRHASSREARLQVEIARLLYISPRMRVSGAKDREQGGIGAKGAGESSLELDRRRIRDRVAELRRELASIEGERGVRRSRRQRTLRVALVGYTNAGKSLWMRKLTTSTVLVEDKLFATLDTTVRTLLPEVSPRILVSDTVGFIQRLPHDLVASFRSTLDEAAEASLLLHIVDASDAAIEAQMHVTTTVLEEVGATAPRVLVLNKIDKVDPPTRAALGERYPDAVLCSAKDAGDVKRMHRLIVARFEAQLTPASLVVPYDRAKIIGEVRRCARVLSESYEEDGVHYELRASEADIARLRASLKGALPS